LADPALFKKNIKNKTIKIYNDYFDKQEDERNDQHCLVEIIKYPLDSDSYNNYKAKEKNTKYSFIKIVNINYMNLIDLSNNKLLLK
jgi:hypothetical protein